MPDAGASAACCPPEAAIDGPLALVRRSGAVVFAVQVAGAGVAYLLQLVLARLLGATQYGTYTYVYLYAGFAALLAGLGMPAASIRFIPAYRAAGEHARSAVFVAHATRVTYATALVGLLAAVVLGVILHTTGALTDPAALVLAALLVPALAGSILNSELARASNRMALAYVAPQIARPALIALAAVLIGTRGHLSALSALAATVLVAYAVLVIQQALTRRLFTPPGVQGHRPAPETRSWLGTGMSLLAVSGFVILLMQADILIVGAILGPRQAGIYAAATKTAALVSFVIVAVNAAGAPQFAALWETGRKDELRRLVARLAGLIFWPSLALAAFLALLARPLLNLFGAGFDQARDALLILLVAQIINAAAGSVGYLLTLTGHHRQAALALAASTVAFIALSSAGTLVAGLTGAAVGSAFGFLVWNGALCWLVVRRLGLWPSVIPAPRLLGWHVGA